MLPLRPPIQAQAATGEALPITSLLRHEPKLGRKEACASVDPVVQLVTPSVTLFLWWWEFSYSFSKRMLFWPRVVGIALEGRSRKALANSLFRFMFGTSSVKSGDRN